MRSNRPIIVHRAGESPLCPRRLVPAVPCLGSRCGRGGSSRTTRTLLVSLTVSGQRFFFPAIPELRRIPSLVEAFERRPEIVGRRATQGLHSPEGKRLQLAPCLLADCYTFPLQSAVPCHRDERLIAGEAENKAALQAGQW